MASSIIYNLCLLIVSCLALSTPTNQTDLVSLLVALKAAINVDSEGSLNSWNQTTHSLKGYYHGIENLVGLTVLSLYYNNLDGPIPMGIGKLTNLQELFLEGNRFTNKIPSSFGNLSLLTELSLDKNNISGVVPKSIGNCIKLLNLDLSLNNLNGPIPREIMNLSSISISLDLSQNAFTGSIPFDVESLISLTYLDLSNNMLSGIIPNSLSSCKSLQQLYLKNNLFEGQIPHGLSSLRGLDDLDLSQNNLSGSIPSFLGELHLQKLNLSFNRLQGEVPTLGVFRNKSAISLEGNENLCGGLSELNLSPCPSSNSSKKNLSTPLKNILIPIETLVALILCLFIFQYKRKTPNNNVFSLSSFFETLFLRLSYADLIKATEGFSETNLVGVGRFGSVYKGILDHDGQHTLIAVKVINLIVKGASKSFMAECNALRGIRHRNLVKILSVCESIDFQGNDFKALIHEFKANGSLEKWLYHNNEQDISSPEVRNLNMIQRLNIAIDIAQPSNILLDHDMTACVGDFGLAKIISNILVPQENASRSTIGIKGIVGYVPPEYGTSDSISTKGDAYSHGILLLEIFTNRRPTDDLFKDNLNLHNFVCTTMPDRVMEIVDPIFRIGTSMNNSKIKDCMASILSTRLSCSRKILRDRLSMVDVVNELHKIKSCYLATDS
ncbi:hypothetical protein DH2020_019742 [Rehmannia glutinosa]|uniref:Protein kinase domain-containing protein n=1 Tax=Rehmannia glutinosa TaxID=99300 RepID=A0ABR0WEE0_REHGL